MKYIIFDRGNDIKYPVIFSKTITHKEIAEKINLEIISAGFIDFEEYIADDFKLYCYGESLGLNVKSRGKIDTKLIEIELSILRRSKMERQLERETYTKKWRKWNEYEARKLKNAEIAKTIEEYDELNREVLKELGL